MAIGGIAGTIGKGYISDPFQTGTGSRDVSFADVMSATLEEKTTESAAAQRVRLDATNPKAGGISRAIKPGENYENAYFRQAQDGVINYKGVTFVCDYETNTLKLGDCSNARYCIRVSLSGGGSLMVNRDNLDDLSKAITLFSPEDMGRIMRAIQADKMAKHAEEELEETVTENEVTGTGEMDDSEEEREKLPAEQSLK